MPKLTDRLFSNPLVVAESAVGSILDRRAVVLYEQTDIEEAKSLLDTTGNRILDPLINSVNNTYADFYNRMKLTELFKGIDATYTAQYTGISVFGISYESANVNIDSEMCEHPIETGAKITDASVLNPITAEVIIRMPTALYTQIYQEIVKYYKEKKKIILLTKFDTYRDMVLSAMPYKLNHDEVDRPAIQLKLQQIIEVESSFVQTESGSVPAIKSSTARNYDDTSREDVGRVFTDTVGSTVSGGAQ